MIRDSEQILKLADITAYCIIQSPKIALDDTTKYVALTEYSVERFTFFSGRNMAWLMK